MWLFISIPQITYGPSAANPPERQLFHIKVLGAIGYYPFVAFVVFSFHELSTWKYSIRDRSWISTWIKSITNELDINFTYPRHNRNAHYFQLWRHQQNERVNELIREDACLFLIIYRFSVSYEKWHNICTPVTNCFALTRVWFCYLFHKYINTNVNPLVTTKTVHPCSPYTIHYICLCFA